MYQNVGCEADKTFLLMDTTRHQQLHDVEDAHTYEDSDDDGILNTNISAIQLNHSEWHNHLSYTLENDRDYPQNSTPLRGTDNVKKIPHHLQTPLNNHTYNVHQKDSAHDTYVLVERPSAPCRSAAYQTYNCAKQLNVTYRKCTSTKPGLVPGIRVSTQPTSRKAIPGCGQSTDAPNGCMTNHQNTTSVNQTYTCKTLGNKQGSQTSAKRLPDATISGNDSLCMRPVCVREEYNQVQNKSANKTYTVLTNAAQNRRIRRTNSTHTKVKKVISQRFTYHITHPDHMITLATL